MLSQVSSLRHTIMALVAIASLMGLAPYSALADPMTYDFIITVEGGGSITGSFTGEDTKNVPRDSMGDPTGPPVACGGTTMVTCDGIIEVGVPAPGTGDNTVIELVALTGKWIPGSSGAPVAFDFSIPSVLIPDFTSPDQVHFQYNTAVLDLTKCPMDITKCPIPDFFINSAGNIIFYPFGAGIINIQPKGDETPNPLPVISQSVTLAPPAAAIPEPSTAILLSLGLVGMILYALARRLRPTAPRRVPVADTTR